MLQDKDRNSQGDEREGGETVQRIALDLIHFKLRKLAANIQELIALGHIPQSYGVAMSELYPAWQQVALRYLLKTERMHLPTFRRFCQHLLERQGQGHLWDGFIQPDDPVPADVEALVSAAEGGKEEEPQYPDHPGLPPVPRARTAAMMLRLYIGGLGESSDPVHQEAACVLGHVYNALKSSRRIQ